jgi:hypothetical protein
LLATNNNRHFESGEKRQWQNKKAISEVIQESRPHFFIPRFNANRF